jgi:hypothetical protein
MDPTVTTIPMASFHTGLSPAGELIAEPKSYDTEYCAAVDLVFRDDVPARCKRHESDLNNVINCTVHVFLAVLTKINRESESLPIVR